MLSAAKSDGGGMHTGSITEVTMKPTMGQRRAQQAAEEAEAATKLQKIWRAKANKKLVAGARLSLAAELFDTAARGDIARLYELTNGQGGKRAIKWERTQDTDGNTALHAAAQYGRVAAVEALLADESSPDIANRLGWTPLHLACRNMRRDGLHVDVATVLLEAGWERTNAFAGSVNREGGFGETALHIAVYNEDRDMARLLLEHGADRSLKNLFGVTPVEAARERGDEMMQALLARAKQKWETGDGY
eukprot:g2451.t1